MKIRGTTVATPISRKAVTNDTSVSKAPWSSKNTVDRLCPAFEVNGSTVTCKPVEGYPLSVVNKIDLVQEGSGTPSPENVRPIVGWTGTKLQHNENEIAFDFGETVYNGSLDWNTGVLTVDAAVARVTSNKLSISSGDTYCYTTTGALGTPKPKGNGNATYRRYCNYFEPYYTVANGGGEFNWKVGIFDNGIIRFGLDNTWTFDQMKAWFDQHEVVISYPIEPYTIQLTPKEILALPGVNTLSCNTGDITVSGRVTTDKAIEDALADLPTGGGGSKPFRLIRTVTIPTDASTDTSGVTWLERSDGGYWFGFDTDADGKPFEITELMIVYNAPCSGSGINYKVNKGAIPFYGVGGFCGWEFTKANTWQWVHFLGPFAQWFGGTNGGTNWCSTTSERFLIADGGCDTGAVSSICTWANNQPNKGLTEGKISFYGR